MPPIFLKRPVNASTFRVFSPGRFWITISLTEMFLAALLLTFTTGGLLAVVFALLSQLWSPFTALPVTTEWIEHLGVEQYRPMFGLLDHSEIRSGPSRDSLGHRMARELRIRIFREYLRDLIASFRLVCAALKLLMVQSSLDRPDLASILFQHQVRFASGLLAVQLRVLLYRWGLCSVDVSNLCKAFNAMRLELQKIVPPRAEAFAG